MKTIEIHIRFSKMKLPADGSGHIILKIPVTIEGDIKPHLLGIYKSKVSNISDETDVFFKDGTNTFYFRDLV